MSKFLVGDRVIAPRIHASAVWVVSNVTGDRGPIYYRLSPHCDTAQCNEHLAHGMHFTDAALEYALGYALPPTQGAPIRPDLYRDEREAIASARSQHQAALNASLAAIRAKHEAEQKLATERRDALTRYTNLAIATTEALKQVKELEGFGGNPTPTPILAPFANELQALVGEFQYRVVTFNGLGVVARKEK